VFGSLRPLDDELLDQLLVVGERRRHRDRGSPPVSISECPVNHDALPIALEVLQIWIHAPILVRKITKTQFVADIRNMDSKSKDRFNA
jgi:hypothetical protein